MNAVSSSPEHPFFLLIEADLHSNPPNYDFILLEMTRKSNVFAVLTVACLHVLTEREGSGWTFCFDIFLVQCLLDPYNTGYNLNPSTLGEKLQVDSCALMGIFYSDIAHSNCFETALLPTPEIGFG
ncbi:unnamed protein product [Lepeophtheirus salmonis]|uniref:(salmon louse) hypothetical protein n=1 Tax=Lepeophtheirus salmonis TaxID=72036 RepID=A0A817FE72_LEPSM|nr:unnamed protein product [Lepeophtheirus salmonis]